MLSLPCFLKGGDTMYNEDVYYYVKNLTPEQFKSHIISGEFAKNVLEKSKCKYNIKTLLKDLVR